MKFQTSISVLALLLTTTAGLAQTDNSMKYAHNLLTVEPAVGIHTNMGTDLLFSAMVQWSPKRKLAFASHSSYNINNITARNVESVHTDYNYSLTQRFGVGTTLYGKRSSHSFFLMGGINYTAYQETLMNADLQPVSTAVSSLSPDYGLLYSLKKGGKKRFFTFRAYIPLYPWPVKGSDINYVDANMNCISLEFGVGFRIK
ncbi:MAG: hypothetical protein JST14_02835 [Bacteroidetes bacterium]|nr:hypothetical protein [Bacteroidota bacterium]